MCGAAQSLSWDYLPAVPQGEDAERRVSWKEKPIGGLVARVLRLSPPPAQPAPPEITRKDEEANAQIDDDRSDKSSITTVEQPAPALNIPRIVIVGEDMSAADITDVQLTPRASNATAATTYRSRNLTLVIPPSPLPRAGTAPPSPLRGVSGPQSPGFATAPSSPVRAAAPPSPMRSLAPSTMRSLAGSTRSLPPTTPINTVHSIHSLEDPAALVGLEKVSPLKRRRCAGLLDFLAPLLKPVTVSLALSLPIALIQPLKALFVDTVHLPEPHLPICLLRPRRRRSPSVNDGDTS